MRPVPVLGIVHRWLIGGALPAGAGRYTSSSVERSGLGAGTALQPGTREASLAELSQRAGFLPKPEAFDERLKPGFRGGKALFVFFLCNAAPFGALLYYLREQREERAQLSLISLPVSADEVAVEALRVIRTSAACFLLQDTEINGTGYGGALRVDPHSPEGTAYTPPTEPLTLLPQLERNVLTDLFESPAVSGLGFIHFAISKSSPLGDAVAKGRRKAGLLYLSHTRGAYCTVSGQLSVLTDPESKRRYWKGVWAASFVDPLPVAAPGQSPKEAPPPWLSGDYMLLRLAVDEACLQSIVDSPQRWESRRVQLIERSSSAEGARWGFVKAATTG